jgi:uncharacterized RDD family membrane protein YckC
VVFTGAVAHVVESSGGRLTPPVNATVTAADHGGRIVSGEAVELDIRIARLGSRAIALVIDAIMMITVVFLTVFAGSLVALVFGGLDGPLAGAVTVISLAMGFIVYPVASEVLSSGRSLGKAAMGLRVVLDDGGPIRLRHALTRALIGTALEFPGLVMPPLTWLASLTMMVANPNGKRLGDLAAGTIVIHERNPASWGWVPPMPPYLAPWAAILDLTDLDDRLALAVRHYLARNSQLKEPARTALGIQLAREVAACTTPPAPPHTHGWAYLAAVLHERNRRSAGQLVRARAAADRIWTPILGRPTAELYPPDPIHALAPGYPQPPYPNTQYAAAYRYPAAPAAGVRPANPPGGTVG